MATQSTRIAPAGSVNYVPPTTAIVTGRSASGQVTSKVAIQPGATYSTGYLGVAPTVTSGGTTSPVSVPSPEITTVTLKTDTKSPMSAVNEAALLPTGTKVGGSVGVKTTLGLPAVSPSLKSAEVIQAPAGIVSKYEPSTYSEKAATQLGLKPGTVAGEFATPFISLGTLGESFIKSPVQTTKSIGVGVYEFGKQTGSYLFGRGESPLSGVGTYLSTTEPTAITARFAGEYISGKGLGIVGSKTSEFTKVGLTRISPIYTPTIEKGGKSFFEVPGETGRLRVDIAGSIGSRTLPTMTSAEQAGLAGKEITAVSAQRSLFGKVFKQEVTIEKPLPSPSSSQIERSFFADPFSRLRVSRGGLKAPKEANVFDIISGEPITFRKERPQALVFEKAKVESFPSSLSNVQSKLLSGKTLTTTEEKRLLEFQLKPSGQFKPIGKLTGGRPTGEPEVTLAPGETLRKQKVIGKTIIQGKPIEIIKPEIFQPTGRTSELLTQTRLTSSETSELSRRLTKESGLSYYPETTKYASPYKGLSYLGGIIKGSTGLSGLSQEGKSLLKQSGTYKISYPIKYKYKTSYPTRATSGYGIFPETKYGTGYGIKYPGRLDYGTSGKLTTSTKIKYTPPVKVKDQSLKIKQPSLSKKGKTRQPFRYTASFSALALGITGKQTKRINRALGYNPYVIRPIPI